MVAKPKRYAQAEKKGYEEGRRKGREGKKGGRSCSSKETMRLFANSRQKRERRISEDTRQASGKRMP